MKLSKATIRNFRRLEDVTIDVEERETVFVGPNNSGEAPATAIFRAFLGSREFKIHDFSVARIAAFDGFGADVDAPKVEHNEHDEQADPFATVLSEAAEPTITTAPALDEAEPQENATLASAAADVAPTLPEISLDLWFKIDPDSIAFGRAYTLLQSLSDDPKVGLRLTFGVGQTVADLSKVGEEAGLRLARTMSDADERTSRRSQRSQDQTSDCFVFDVR